MNSYLREMGFREAPALSLFAAAGLALGATVATAQDDADPYAKADDTWINIGGTVESVRSDYFVMDYGEGEIVVEMDDGDRDADAYKLMRGDKVTVSGRIDDDFFEGTTIEASSVYVENLDTTFFASAIDEENPEALAVTVTAPVEISTAVVYGTVTSVSDDEFVLDTGVRELTVDTDEMPYNPVDDEGYQKIEVGDRVRVRGRIDDDLFEGRELMARAVTTLHYGVD